LAHNTQDDGFHEIQLNGKQLVFLFMAATVVSVVIFLCGVLVGRGVRAERNAAADAVALNTGPSADAPPAMPVAGTPAPAPAGSDPTVAVPPPAIDELSYFNRLETKNQPAEDLKLTPAAASAAETPASAEARAAVAAPTAKEPARPAAAPAAQEPAGQAYAVQVAALNVRGEADGIAKRLASKGYAAYVVAPASGTPAVYRVRVGTFKTRREAETVAARLEKEEQFKPWVTR